MKINKINLNEKPEGYDFDTIRKVHRDLLDLVDQFNSLSFDCNQTIDYLKANYSFTGTYSEGGNRFLEFDVGDIAAMIIFNEREHIYSLYNKCTIFKPGSMECLDNFDWERES